MSLTAERQKHLDDFCAILEQLLESITIVFPECDASKRWHKRMAEYGGKLGPVKRLIIGKWHNQLEPFYKEIHEKNAKIIHQIKSELFFELEIPQKWNDPDFGDDSKEIMWVYLDQLNNQANLFHIKGESNSSSSSPSSSLQ